jgi:hypothetical protein
MLSSTKRLLEARAKHGIPTARRQWGAVLRRGYAEGDVGSARQGGQADGVKGRNSFKNENSAPDGSPRQFSFRKHVVAEDTTGQFGRHNPGRTGSRSIKLGREEGAILSKDAKSNIEKNRAARPPKLDRKDDTTLSKDAKSKIKENLAARSATSKPIKPQLPKTRYRTRELATDASFGVVTTSRPLATPIDELVGEIQPMPQDEASDSSEDTVSLVLLMTPGLARYALDSTVPKAVVQRLQPSERFGKKYITTTAIVDRLPTTNDESEGAEGMAYMLFRNPPSASAGDQVPLSGSAQKPGSLTFQMPRIHHRTQGFGTAKQNLQLPLTQTVFTTGLVSTMILREYTHGGMETSLELTSERKLESQTVQMPALANKVRSHRMYMPLVPLTPFRKIHYVMGNIIRKLSAQQTWELQPNEKDGFILAEKSEDVERDVPASQDLERAVSKYFEVLDLQPETVSVWALVIPTLADSKTLFQGIRVPGVRPMLTADEDTLSAAWDPKTEASKEMFKLASITIRTMAYHGARLIKVLSGGGGWGKKAGLLSLDPDVQYSTRELRQDAGWQFDFDGPDDGTGAAIEAQKNQALGQIVKEGESIMFLLAPKPQNLPMTYSETQMRDERGVRMPSELELSFGAIPSSIDDVARSPESDETPAVIQHYPNFFGMLSEGGMAFRHTTPNGSKVFQSKLDVPSGRFTYKQHFDVIHGTRLEYYPDALIKGDPRPPPTSAKKKARAGQSVESSAKEDGAEIHKLFRGMADDEEHTTPL